MSKLRGWLFVFSTAMSMLGAASLRAQSNQLTLTDVDSTAEPAMSATFDELSSSSDAPVVSVFGKTPMMAMPVAFGAPGIPPGQTPRAIAPSQLNPSAFPAMSPSMIAPASYAEVPYGQSPFAQQAYGPMGMPPGGYPMPASFGGEDPGSMMSGPTEMSGEFSGGMEEGSFCPACGGQGCENCMGYGDGVLGGFLKRLLPYAEGGRCAPRWYDISVDGMYVKRDKVGENVNFTSSTRLAAPGGTIVLSTGNLNYEEELGLRFTGALQVLPGHNLEFTYFGLFNWASVATFVDGTNNLFSLYSGFGANPFNGFLQTDQSQFQSLRSSSTIDSFEINIRKRNTGPNCRLQWSTLWGARYVYLLDDLEYFTLGGPGGNGLPVGQSDSDVRLRNSLTGFQVGGDMWANIVPGISLGTDVKAGVYGNYSKQNTSVIATNNAGIVPPIFEEARNNDIAFLGEGSITLIYRTSPNLTMRMGYSFVYLDGVALAADNFNTTNPFGIGRTAKPVDDNSDVFYHGAFSGFEWMW